MRRITLICVIVMIFFVHYTWHNTWYERMSTDTQRGATSGDNPDRTRRDSQNIHFLFTLPQSENQSMKMVPFEHMNTSGCFVEYAAKKIKSRKKPLCNLEFFDNYLQETGQMYGDGIWYAPETKFIPKGCAFGEQTRTAESLLRCLTQKNIWKILITGDSTGRILTALAANYLSGIHGVKCRQTRHSKGNQTAFWSYDEKTETQHFLVPGLSPEVLQATSCGYQVTCYSSEYECRFSESTQILNLEYISTIRIMDTTLIINRHGIRQTHQEEIRAESKMEYVLKYYLPHRGFPDLWIYSPMNRHEAWPSSITQIISDYTYMFQLMDLYLPRTTDLIFLGDTRECEAWRGADWIQKFKDTWGMTRNEKMHQINQVLYTMLRRVQREMSNVHGFLDGMSISCPLECRFHRDAAHLNHTWFRELFSSILNTECVS